MSESHYYVAGAIINRCLWCDGPPEDSDHIKHQYEDDSEEEES